MLVIMEYVRAERELIPLPSIFEFLMQRVFPKIYFCPPSDLVSDQGLEFDMKYHILHDFRTSTGFEEKSSNHFKDLYKLKLLPNFDVNLISFLGGATNYVLSV